jgi:hypothetical protein
MGSWKEKWYHNIPEVLRKAEEFYTDLGKDPFRVTAKQVKKNANGWYLIPRFWSRLFES